MDFLDPKLKKAHRRRLFIGYILMAIAISMGTLILLFSAYGYDIDRKTGEIVRNGTINLESKPSGASVSVNGKGQNDSTATKLALPGGMQYTVNLSKEGYKTWTRIISLESGSIERVEYPILVPEKIITSEVQLYSSAPVFASQSQDQKKLLILQPGQNAVFELYDLQNPKNAPKILTLPAGLLTSPNSAGSYKTVEWSSDNKQLLLSRGYDSKTEFIVIDTEDAARSKNVNTALSMTPTNVKLIDGKADSLYTYESDNGTVRKATLATPSVSEPILTKVIAFDSVGKDTIVYATNEGAKEGGSSFRVSAGDGVSYLLKDVPLSENYYVAADIFDGVPYLAVGTNKTGAAFVYRDALQSLKDKQKNSPVLIKAVMRGDNPSNPQFSTKDHGFISVQTNQGMVVYDIEHDRQFTFKTEGTALQWEGDYHFSYVVNNEFYLVDFDGSNPYKLATVSPSMYGYLAPNYEKLFSLSPSPSVSGRTSLLQSDLRIN